MQLQLEVSDLAEQPVEIQTTLEIKWFDSFLNGKQATGFNAATPQLFRGKVFRAGDSVVVEAECSLQLEAECSRCLKNFTCDLPVSFQRTLRPRPESSNALPIEQELTSEDLDDDFYDNELIDLEGIIREQILLALPMVPKCSEECLGLCATCGKDLNQGPCGCEKVEIDPRWNSLKSLVH